MITEVPPLLSAVCAGLFHTIRKVCLGIYDFLGLNVAGLEPSAGGIVDRPPVWVNGI